jgi:Flp pilus assembly protein TadG
LRGFLGDQSGVLILVVALAMPVLFGTMGLAAEASYWYLRQRAMQNAADAAASAAATNANSSGYLAEAKAVAAQYVQDHWGNLTVNASQSSTATGCTSEGASSECYTVTVSDKVPLFLSQVARYRGSVNSPGMTTLVARSVAQSKKGYSYCILALGTVTNDIVSNGAPMANLNNCNVMSNTGAVCHGGNLNAAVGDAHTTNDGCGLCSKLERADDRRSLFGSRL